VEIEVTATAAEIVQEAHQIGKAPAQAIHGIGRYEVDLAPMDSLEEPVEGRPLIPASGAADAVILEDLDHGPAGSIRDFLEKAALILGRLTVGADTEVEGGSLHLQDDPTDRRSVKEKSRAPERCLDGGGVPHVFDPFVVRVVRGSDGELDVSPLFVALPERSHCHLPDHQADVVLGVVRDAGFGVEDGPKAIMHLAHRHLRG